MGLDLKDKVALVTGAGSQQGIGRSIALTLAKDGCDVIVTDINLEGAQKIADEVEALGCKAIALKADILNQAEVKEMVKAGLDKFGKIDILVNNAGMCRKHDFIDGTEDLWTINVEVNLKGMWYVTMAVLPQMLKRKSGKIINLSSGTARIGIVRNVLYCSAKAGVNGFTRALAAEVGPSGINVNGVAPGMVLTQMFIDVGTNEEQKQNFIDNAPMRRTTAPQDIANAVAFFASDASSDITGQTIQVDGGALRV